MADKSIYLKGYSTRPMASLDSGASDRVIRGAGGAANTRSRPHPRALAQENHPHDPAKRQHRDRREQDKSRRTAEVVIEQEHNPGEPSHCLHDRT